MAHDKVYGICENKCMVELMNTDELVTRATLIATGLLPKPNAMYQTFRSNSTAGKYPDETFKYVETRFGITAKEMFSGCYNLTEVDHLDTTNCTNFTYTFLSCSKLTKICNLNTALGIQFDGMFGGCGSLTTCPDLNLENANKTFNPFNAMFNQCTALTTFTDNPFAPEGSRWQFKDNIDFSSCPLDKASILKVFNGLQVVTGKTIIISSTTNG